MSATENACYSHPSGTPLKIMPDLDMPRSTISRTLGPATVLLSIGVARLAGGHRAATHSLAFAALLPTGVWTAMHTPVRAPSAPAR